MNDDQTVEQPIEIPTETIRTAFEIAMVQLEENVDPTVKVEEDLF